MKPVNPSNPVKYSFFPVIAVLLVLFSHNLLWAAMVTPDLLGAMQGTKQQETIPVIISLRDKVRPDDFRHLKRTVRRGQLIRALRQKADATQNPIVQMLGQGKSHKFRQLWLTNGIAVSTDKATIRKLSKLAAVESIRLDIAIPLGASTVESSAPPEWNLMMTNADILWANGYSGDGVVVASMDTGVDPDHPDLAGRWRGGVNSWYDPNGQHSEPYDANGHGTQTMGLIAGGDTDGSVIGMAPSVQWIAVKIFNDSDVAPLSSIHLGFQWLLDPDGNPGTDDSPNIVNNSWGFVDTAGSCYQEFATDIDLLKVAGIAVVFAAGNTGPSENTSISPANNPGAFPVGSLRSDYLVSYDSSSGPNACSGAAYPDITAPGEWVKTTDLTFGGLIPDSYAYVTGTSFAAPHATGAMALLLSAVPGLSPEQLEAILRQSTLDLGAPGPDNAYGHGLLDVSSAYLSLGEALACSDDDRDGYFTPDGCGTPVDCNDSDPAVHPGALEIPDDGVDQNCDNVNLPDTVTLIRADYLPDSHQLRLWATTDAPEAVLAYNGSVLSEYVSDPHILNGGYRRLYLDGVAVKPDVVTVTSELGGADTRVPRYIAEPEAVSDNFEAVQDVELVIPGDGVLGNDLKGGYIWSSEALRSFEATAPSNGSLVLNGEGSFTYTPNPGFVGLDSFTYYARIENLNTGAIYGMSNEATVSITVSAAGGGPSDTVSLLRADYLADAQQLRLWATTDDPTAVLSYGGVSFADFVTEPHILNGGYYRLYLDGVAEHPGAVTVTSSGGGSDTRTPRHISEPMAIGDAFEAAENTALAVAAEGILGNDLKGGFIWGSEVLRAVLATAPSHGDLVLNPDGSFSYTPDPGFAGSDGFTYHARIENLNTGAIYGMSNEAAVSIAVGSPGGEPSDTVTLLRTDYLADAQQLRLWATTDDPAAVLSYGGISFADFVTDPHILNGGYYRLYLDGVAEHPGEVTVTSSAGGSDSRTPRFVVQPQAIGDSFEATRDSELAVAAEGILGNDLKGGFIWGSEILRAGLSTTPSHGELVLNADGSFIYTPNPGFVGSDGFTYNVRIENLTTGATYGLSNDATVSIDVLGQ
ncbi:MAG: S8 family serine peptidase [Desulfobacterales bacterium]